MCDPAPAAMNRWLTRCYPDGERPTTVELRMTGRIKLKGWLPFSATQVIDARRGFVWAARVGRWPLVIRGSDRYLDGAGAMDWKLWGRRTVVAESGVDVTRSAAWRLAAEALTWLPLGSDDVTWQAGPVADVVTARRTVGDEDTQVDLHIDADGRLVSVAGPRWGNPLGRPFGYYPFGVDLLAETTVDGITVPSAFTASWFYGTPDQHAGEFFRSTISAVRFGAELPPG